MKALIVEDNVKQAETTRRKLTKCGFECDIATDGLSGYKMLIDGDYTIALVDIKLPKMNGLDLIRKANEQDIRTPIIVLSVLGSVDSRIAGLDAGADDYLAKPFSLEELRARIDARLRGVKKSTAPLRCDTLILDPIHGTATRSGRDLGLSRKEFQLLEYLMSRRGQIISKYMIRDDLWNYTGAANIHVVEMGVSALRKKVNGDTNERPLIRTVRSLGYVID